MDLGTSVTKGEWWREMTSSVTVKGCSTQIQTFLTQTQAEEHAKSLIPPDLVPD